MAFIGANGEYTCQKQCKTWVAQLLTHCSNPSWQTAFSFSDNLWWFHKLDSDEGGKKSLTISSIIATCNPRERRRNEAINSKEDLSGCARSEHWFSLDWTPHCCPFVIYVRLTSLFQQWHLFPIYSFQGTYCGFHFVSWFSFFWLLWSKAPGVVFI